MQEWYEIFSDIPFEVQCCRLFEPTKATSVDNLAPQLLTHQFTSYFAFCTIRKGRVISVFSQTWFLHRLNEIDRLSETNSLDEKRKPNFCEFSEPYTAEVEEVFNKTETRAFRIPCSDLNEGPETRTKRDMCEVFRYEINFNDWNFLIYIHCFSVFIFQFIRT